jgi:hypothetical protein
VPPLQVQGVDKLHGMLCVLCLCDMLCVLCCGANRTSPAERPSLSAIFRHPFLRRYRKRAAGGSPQASGLEPAASCDSWGSSLTASYEPPV